jgi:S-formylglutathione hydrolase FrmB
MFASREAARQATVILQLNPLNWPRHQLLACDPLDDEWQESADRLSMKLSSMGIPFESDLTTSAGGHGWEYFEKMARPALDFVAVKLDEESRRL